MELNFVFYNFSQDTPTGNAASLTLQNHQVCGLLKEACRQGWIRRLWTWITRRPCRLPAREDLQACAVCYCN